MELGEQDGGALLPWQLPAPLGASAPGCVLPWRRNTSSVTGDDRLRGPDPTVLTEERWDAVDGCPVGAIEVRNGASSPPLS